MLAQISGDNNDWQLAAGHYNHAKKIPQAIRDYVPKDIRESFRQNPVPSD